MNIAEAAERYDVDAATIWEWIVSHRVVRSPEDHRVILVANPEEREGTLWIVREEPV